jgi:hypothetical protein
VRLAERALADLVEHEHGVVRVTVDEGGADPAREVHVHGPDHPPSKQGAGDDDVASGRQRRLQPLELLEGGAHERGDAQGLHGERAAQHREHGEGRDEPRSPPRPTDEIDRRDHPRHERHHGQALQDVRPQQRGRETEGCHRRAGDDHPGGGIHDPTMSPQGVEADQAEGAAQPDLLGRENVVHEGRDVATEPLRHG